MSTAVVTPPAEPVQFDPKAHFEQRNAAEQARKEGKEPVKAAPAPPGARPAAEDGKTAVEEPKHPPEQAPRQSRSARREQNRLREEIGELRGRLAAYEEFGVKPNPAVSTAAADDPEPKIQDFASEGEYYRALGRWDARQEVKKAESKLEQRDTQKNELEQLKADIAAAEAKAQTDIKDLFPDWDEVSEKSAEDEDAPEFVPADHPMFMMMLARSDMKARILYHFAKNPEELERMLELTKDSNKQIAAFHRLEGRVEKLYDKPKAAQAAEPVKEAPKDRNHPAEAVQPAGRTAPSAVAESDARKPRPSTEVAARGGSAPPEEPAIGSAAWLAQRNATEASRRGR